MKNVKDLKSKEVIYCSTLEEALAICRLMHSEGLTWNSGASYLKHEKFLMYQSGVCFRPAKGEHGNLSYFKDNRYIIYPASDFLDSYNLKEIVDKNTKDIESINLKLGSMTLEAKKQLAVVVDEGYAYTTHTRAREYGMTNYHHWLNLPQLKVGDVVEIVKTC